MSFFDRNIPSSRRPVIGVYVVLLFCLLAAIIAESGRYSIAAQAIGAASIAVTFGHAVLGLGWRDALTFAAMTLAVTFTIENIGVATEFPFGAYQFELPHIPRIGAVPIIVGPLYFGMGYLSWVIANLIYAGSVTRPKTLFDTVAIALISAFVMTQWDVVMDPGGSTLARAWTWRQGGGYFGVPLSNFLGWLLTAGTFLILFSFHQYSRRNVPDIATRSRSFWMVAVLLYLASGFSQIVPFLTDQNQVLVDPSGQAWQSRDLRETAVIVMMMTMVPSGLFAALRLYQPR